MKAFDYQQPLSLREFLDIKPSPENMIIAGGTDILPRIHYGVIAPARLIDISGIGELDFILEDESTLHIGSLTTYAQILENRRVRQHAPMLIAAIRSIGAPMTRARATIGGNIANASPAGDTLTPLIALDANLKLISQTQCRTVPLEDFFIGAGKTILEDGELVHTISFPKPDGIWGTAFRKIGPRRGMTISIANTAVLLSLNSAGEITTCRVVCGAVAPTPRRCLDAENLLINQLPSSGLWEQAAQRGASETTPISDVRGSEAYRRKLVKSLIQKCLTEAYEKALERSHK